jgi:hypothetical protein
MRRKIILAAFVATSICCSLPALAAGGTTKPQIHDPKGDWAVASQDILDGTVTASATKIVADLHLAAPPASGVHSQYAVVISVGCKSYILHYEWNGGLPGSTAGLDAYACPTAGVPDELLSNAQATATYAASAAVTATGIRITAAPTKDLHSGVTVQASATTRLANVLVILGTGGTGDSLGGDIAYDAKTFVLGG